MPVEKPTGLGRAGAGENRHSDSTDDPLSLVSENHEFAPKCENLGSLNTAGPRKCDRPCLSKMGLDLGFALDCTLRFPAWMPKT
jgi:hypothetical protein